MRRQMGDGGRGRGWYCPDCVHIALNVGNHIGDCVATGMVSLQWVGSRKGRVRRCNDHAVPHPPAYRWFRLGILDMKLHFGLLLGNSTWPCLPRV